MRPMTNTLLQHYTVRHPCQLAVEIPAQRSTVRDYQARPCCSCALKTCCSPLHFQPFLARSRSMRTANAVRVARPGLHLKCVVSTKRTCRASAAESAEKYNWDLNKKPSPHKTGADSHIPQRLLCGWCASGCLQKS